LQILIAERVVLELVEPPPAWTRYFEEWFGQFARWDGSAACRRITVRFADRVSLDGCRFAAPTVAARDEHVYFVPPAGGTYRIPVSALGCSEIEITATRNTRPVGFDGNILRGLIQVSLMQEGMTLVQSSSMSVGGGGTLLPAWSGTGKTNLLIEAILHGADALSDDFSILSSRGVLYSYPRPLNVFDHNCRRNPALMRRYLRSKWHWYAASRTVNGTARLASAMLDRRSLLATAVNHLAVLSRQSLSLSIAPDSVRPGARFARSAPLRRVLWLMRTASEDVHVGEGTAGEVAEAIALTLAAELPQFFSILRGWEYATGGRVPSNMRPESFHAAVAAVVRDGVRAATIRRAAVPSGVAPRELFEALRSELGFEAGG
jgi:hypothetical protein